MVMGGSPWAGWIRVAYTNVDTARRMGEGFSASDEPFTACGRMELGRIMVSEKMTTHTVLDY